MLGVAEDPCASSHTRRTPGPRARGPTSVIFWKHLQAAVACHNIIVLRRQVLCANCKHNRRSPPSITTPPAPYRSLPGPEGPGDSRKGRAGLQSEYCTPSCATTCPTMPFNDLLPVGTKIQPKVFLTKVFGNPLGSRTPAPSRHGYPRPNACFFPRF